MTLFPPSPPVVFTAASLTVPNVDFPALILSDFNLELPPTTPCKATAAEPLSISKRRLFPASELIVPVTVTAPSESLSLVKKTISEPFNTTLPFKFIPLAWPELELFVTRFPFKFIVPAVISIELAESAV